MSEPHPIAVQNFSHVCIGVSDIEASLAFYSSVLGMDVVFDVELEGAGHLVNLERPAAFNAALDQFLEADVAATEATAR